MSFFYSSGTRIAYSVLDLDDCCGYDFQTSPGGSGDQVRSLPGTVVVKGR